MPIFENRVKKSNLYLRNWPEVTHISAFPSMFRISWLKKDEFHGFRYKVNEKEAEIVRFIFDEYIKGFTYSEILMNLNKLGYKTKRGTEFSKSGFNKILSNEKYTGVYLFNQYANKNALGKRNSTIKKSEDEIIRIEGGMPAIISKEDFEKVQKIMSHNKRCRGGKKAKANYLLSGLIKCGECGFSMYGNKRPSSGTKEYISYRCGCRNSKSKIVCDNKEMRKELIEEFVLAELEKKILCDEMIPKITEELNKQLAQQEKKQIDHKVGLEDKLAEVNKEINNIVEAIMAGIHNQTLKDKMNELEEVKANLEIEIASNRKEEKVEEVKQVTEEQVRIVLSKMKQFIQERNLPQCKQLIRDFVKEVKVYKDHVEVIFNVVYCIGKNKVVYEERSEAERGKLAD